MNKIIIFILISISMAFSQSVKVVERNQLTHQEDGKYFFPQFSPDDSKLLVTSAKYRGLWYLDLNTSSIVQLNNYAGSGYQPVFTSDGRTIIYKKNIFEKGRRYSSLYSFDLNTNKERLIQSSSREIKQVKMVDDNLIYRQGSAIQQIKGTTLYSLTSSDVNSLLVFSDRNRLIIEDSNGSRAINPIGDGHYIWSSVSPDKNRLLFTVAGRGTYITDLSGNLMTDLGRAHAPQWSPDGQWVLYMDDRDDGEQYTSSTINVVKSDGSEKITLTKGKNLAMYPAWSSDGKRVVYHTLNGEIYLLLLEYGEDLR